MSSTCDTADRREWSRLARELRARLAVNHFKRVLLGRKHVPGKAQGDEVFGVVEARAWQAAPKPLRDHPKFDALGWVGFRLTQRGWENWFGVHPLIPRRSKVAALDAAARVVARWRRPSNGTECLLPPNFYRDAVHGGLLAALVADTDASAPSTELLHSRARGYRLLSAWHLHLDALELGAFKADWRGLSWRTVVAVGCERLLEELHRLWRPGSGAIYESLSAMSGRFWDLSADEARMLHERLAGSGVPPEMHSTGDRSPNWICVGVEGDAPSSLVHHLLFAIGADHNFARDDRLAAWALDLATAALVANLLALLNQQAADGGVTFTKEKILAAALDALMLSGPSASPAKSNREARHLGEYRRELRAAMDRTGGDWRFAGESALRDARMSYRTEMSALGITADDIDALAVHATRGSPRIYGPQEPPW